MCIIGRSFASTDLKLPRGFDLDPMLLVYRRGFSEMAILYYFFASTGDLAIFGQNRFSWPAMCFLMRLFTNKRIRNFQVFICIKELKKKNQPQRTKFGVMAANQSQFWLDRIFPVCTGYVRVRVSGSLRCPHGVYSVPSPYLNYGAPPSDKTGLYTQIHIQ